MLEIQKLDSIKLLFQIVSGFLKMTMLTALAIHVVFLWLRGRGIKIVAGVTKTSLWTMLINRGELSQQSHHGRLPG